MAGLLPPVLAQYTSTTTEKALEMVALICTGKMQAKTSIDVFDPLRLSTIGTPNTLLKNSLSQIERFKTLGESVPSLVEEVTIYGTDEINKLNNIITGFVDKTQYLLSKENATTAAITKCVTDFTHELVTFIQSSISNIVTLVIRDLMMNCVYVLTQILTWWPPYILETAATGIAAMMTPDLDPLVSGATPWDIPRGIHGVFESIWITILMVQQILFILTEVIYLLLRIVEYMVATIIGEILLVLTFLEKLTPLAAQLPIILGEFTEQMLGLLSTQPLPMMIMNGMLAATLELAAIQASAETTTFV